MPHDPLIRRSAIIGLLVGLLLPVAASSQMPNPGISFPVGSVSSGGGTGTPTGSVNDIQTNAGGGNFGHLTPGTGIATALGINAGTAGAPVINGGALGTPSSGVGTNLTGTAAGLTAGAVPASGITGTTLAAGVTASSLTTVGALSSGSIASGFGTIQKWTFTPPTTATTLTPGGDNLTYTMPATTSTIMANNFNNATISQHSPADGGSHAYTFVAGDLTQQNLLVGTFTSSLTPQATGSFAAPADFFECAAGALTATATTSTINGIAGATGIKFGANQCGEWTASGGNWGVSQTLPQPATQTGVNGLLDNMTWGKPTLLLATGTSVSLTAPTEVYVCTGTCTVTPPVPAAGYQFCVMNTDNVATVITLAALGSSARYENTARTAYGTAGTGTFISGGAVGDAVCLLGLDSTHYLTPSSTGTWVAN